MSSRSPRVPLRAVINAANVRAGAANATLSSSALLPTMTGTRLAAPFMSVE
jgi:hypothetical protein